METRELREGGKMADCTCCDGQVGSFDSYELACEICVETRTRQVAALLDACKKMARCLSHISDIPNADPLKYLPVSAYKEARKAGKQAIAAFGK